MQKAGEQPAGLSVEEQKEQTKGNEQQDAYASEYVVKLEAELRKVCDGILALIDENLIHSACTRESKVFYHKMKDDYYPYLAEFATGDAKSKVAKDAHEACAEPQRSPRRIWSLHISFVWTWQ